MRRLLLALLLLAAPGLTPPLADEPAGEPVSPSEFRDYAEGWTLHFEHQGEPIGEEAFEPGGETLWRFRDGTCLEGVWKPHGGQLCFYYGQGDEVLCWRAWRDAEGLYFRLLGEGPDAGMELRVTGRDKQPPLCGGPGRAT